MLLCDTDRRDGARIGSSAQRGTAEGFLDALEAHVGESHWGMGLELGELEKTIDWPWQTTVCPVKSTAMRVRNLRVSADGHVGQDTEGGSSAASNGSAESTA
ncbi:hypothetical protein Q5752_000576 [Cryptotrichosporon argae]